MKKRLKSFPRPFRKLFLETLECRRVFANGFQSAPGVPVDASFVAGGQTHGFEVTSVGGDSDANGLVNSRTLNLSGRISGPNANVFTDTHAGLTLDAKLVSSGLIVGTTGTFVGNAQTATFSNMQITLPVGDGIYSVRLEFSRNGFGTVPIQLAATTVAQDLVGRFTLDQTPPTVRSISQPTTPRNTPVSAFSVELSETVSSFPVSALNLKRNGIDVSLSGVSISLINGTTYQITGLTSLTASEGAYAFSVNPVALLDSAGNSGTGSAVSVQFEVDLTPPNVQAPQLDPQDDTGNGLQDGGADGITTRRSDLSYSSVSSTASAVEFELQQLLRGSFTNIATNQGVLVSGVFVTDFQSNAGFEDGTYRVRAKATKPSGTFAFSSFSPLVIDNANPIAPTGLRTATGSTTLKVTPAILFDSVENGAAVELFRNSVAVGTRLIPANAAQVLNSILPPESGSGVFRYQVRQIDQAGNVGPLSQEFALAIDATPPVIDAAAATKFRMAQSDLSEPNSELPVLVTTSYQPTFLARISDQAFADRNNVIKVELLVDGVATAIDNANFAITPSTTGFTSVSVRPSSPLAAKKVLPLQLRVTDQAGNVTTSTGLQVFVNQVGAATQNAPGTPIFNEKWYIGANFTSPSNFGRKGMFTVEVDQAIPAATIISINGTGATDSSKRFEVTKSVTDVNTGKTVLTLKTALTADVSSSTPLMWLRPWTTTFDKATQTTWLTMEDGVSVANFDPTNGNVKFYSIGLRDPLTGVARYGDPHGVTFDFNSHLTPRVWFVYRNENLDRDLPDFGDPTKPFDSTARGPGTVAFLDVETNTLRSFEIDDSLFTQPGSPADFDLAGTHAIFVDTRGHVWLTTETSVMEIDTSRFPDGKPTGTLSSSDGTIILHKLPAQLGDTGSKSVPFQPHGIQVIVDQRTGKPYVFMADGDAKSGTARTVLLQPGTNGEPDQWKEWNFDALLLSEANPPQNDVPPSATLFLAVDDNETPGTPEDDRLIAASPGALVAQGAKGIMRVLDLSSVLEPIVQSDLAKLSGKTLPQITEPTTAPVTSYRLPGIPGSTQPFASNQVPLLDRAGNIYFVDAIGGVGRFNANDPNSDFLLSKSVVGLKNYTSQSISRTIKFDATKIEPVRFAAKAVGSPGTKIDRSTAAGLDQYDASITPNATQGGNGAGGMFRGALNAENSLYGSNSSSDNLSTTLFAESNRRNVAVVSSPFELPKGARIGGRVALQVLRDGSVVVTARGDGELLDEQVNLTKALLNSGKIASFDDAAVLGDMAAIGNPDGSIEALGRQGDGRLIRYSFTPASKSWTTADLKNAKYWTANTRISVPVGQLVAEDPQSAPDIGFTVTTSSGHLIVIPSGGVPKDLSAAAGSPAVYSGVGAIRVGEKLRFYGTNQTGSVIEYVTDLNLGNISTRTLAIPASANARETRMLRNIDPLFDGTTIHLFGTDGVSRLVHYEVNTSSTVTLAENVTQVVQKSGEVYGYFNFEQPFGGRVYTYVSAIRQKDGTLRVYGTNGGELIEFTRDAAGKWRVGNLTNNIKSTDPVANDSRIPANFVFGAPSVYEDQLNERHVLQINAEGEIIEYYMLANDPQKRFHTQNINLRIGSDSLVTNLRFRATPLASTASLNVASTTSKATSANAAASVFAAPYIGSLDANADGELSPLDVLTIINYLNSPVAANSSNVEGDGESSGNRLDVNGDGWVSPLDVLTLINHLNGVDGGEGDGEGEAASSNDETIAPSLLDFAFADMENWDSFHTTVRKQRR